MYQYKAKECRCWSDYPNKMCKRKDQWKCVDDYELVKVGDYRRKTRCKLKEDKNGKQA